MYTQFEQKYNADKKKYGEANWQYYEGRVPDTFVTFIRENGIASFDHGFLWTVNPEQFEPILEDWNLDPEADIVIARTGVGDLFLWNGEDIYILDCHHGTLEQVSRTFEMLFDYFLCDLRYLNKVHFRKQFQQAAKEISPLNENTCLHFVPALALGGPDAAGNLQAVDIGICHSLLSQIHIT